MTSPSPPLQPEFIYYFEMNNRLASAVALFLMLASACSVTPSVGTQDAVEIADPPWTQSIRVLDQFVSSASGLAPSPDGQFLALANRDGVCIVGLAALQDSCVQDETIGIDRFTWNADSSLVLTGGQRSGRWTTTSVWTVTPDGTATPATVRQPGDLLTEGTPTDFPGSFLPNGDLLYVALDEGLTEIGSVNQISPDGSNQREWLALPDAIAVNTEMPVVALDMTRALFTVGLAPTQIEMITADGERSVVFAPDPDDGGPIVIAATPSQGVVALLMYPDTWLDESGEVAQSRWNLSMLDGTTAALPLSDGQRIVGAALSPDGQHVSYVSVPTDGSLGAELHVASVPDVLAGGTQFKSTVLNPMLEHDQTQLSAVIRGNVWWGDSGKITYIVTTPDNTAILTVYVSP